MKNIYIIIFIISFLYFKIYSKHSINLIKNRFNMSKSDVDDGKGKKIILNGKPSKPNQDIKKFKINMGNLNYGNIIKGMNITEAESCKKMNKMLGNDVVKNNIEKLFLGRSVEEKRNVLDFLLKHSAFIDFLEKDISYIENTYNSLKNLEKDIRNEELVSLYDAMLSNSDLVDLLKDKDPNNLEKLSETIKLYSKIDKKEKVPIENTFEYVYRKFVYYVCPAEYLNLYKDNRNKFRMIFRDIIKPAFNEYIMNVGALYYYVTKEPGNKTAINALKGDVKKAVESLTETAKKRMEEYGSKEQVVEGFTRKVNGCKMSCKENKVFIT